MGRPFMLRSIFALGTLLALLAGGCTAEKPEGFAAALPPAPLPNYVMTRPADGAVFQPASGYAPLHYGSRAHRVGDIITVILAERIDTRKSTRATTARDGSIALSPPSVGPLALNPGLFDVGADADFKGQGNAAQAASLSGTISVTIAEVLPGGMAHIRGEKIFQLSQGEEWVQLSGIVRLADIDVDNTVVSLRIADAHIAYSGKGSVQQASREGWLGRFFTKVSPF